MTPNSQPPLIISLMFCLENEQGHIYSYNRSVGQAAHLVGWDDFAAVRAAAKVTDLPENWSLCLGPRKTFFQWQPLARVEKMLKIIKSLIVLLRQHQGEARPVIYLLEWFDPLHLIAFCVALCLTRRGKNGYVWIVHRFEFSRAFITRLYRFLQALIRWRVGRERLVLFSETDLVARSLVKTFGQAVYVLPMPQIVSAAEQPAAQIPRAAALRQAAPGKMVCWWPGMPAVDKGLATIARLISLTGPDAQRLCLVADQRTKFAPVPGGCDVILLPPGMRRAEYVGWLHAMDLALLPYWPSSYATRTSGPFADALAAGKPPAVSDGTWMAHELRKFELDELIVDWDSPNVTSDLLRLAADDELKPKLARMQAAYARFHSVPGYAETIQHVFAETHQ